MARRLLAPPRPEQPERARVPVQERRPADGADLAVAEEPAHRDGPDALAEQIAVVVRPAVEVHAPPKAREQERPRRARPPRLRPVARQAGAEVLGGGARVAQVELDGLVATGERADGQRARRRIGAEDVADEEVAGR